MTADSDQVLSGCLSRLENLLGAIDRLQRAHALRLSNPASERPYQEVRLAKAAIDTDCQILKIKITQVRGMLATEEQEKKTARRRRSRSAAIAN